MESTTTQTTTSSEPAHVHDDFAPLRNYFDIHDPSDVTTGRFKDIYEYLRHDKGEYSEFDLIRDVKDLSFKLGTPALGESRLDQMHRFAKLSRQARDIQKEIEGMQR
jgi:hypothetical protein